MALNPPTQYRTDGNLRARQRLWEGQQPKLDIVGWVLALAGLSGSSGSVVLDVGCGNGMYLRELRRRRVEAVGCDLSMGMLATTGTDQPLVNADAVALPFRSGTFDVLLAPHMLYHVDDRVTAAAEFRRVLRPDGSCVVVTNGERHMRSLRDLVEAAVRTSTPGWEMRNPATHAFSLENGASQLARAFDVVEVVRPADVAPVRLREARIAGDYVASVADHYAHETSRPWSEVVDEVTAAVRQQIDENGEFVVAGDSGAFLCK